VRPSARPGLDVIGAELRRRRTTPPPLGIPSVIDTRSRHTPQDVVSRREDAPPRDAEDLGAQTDGCVIHDSLERSVRATISRRASCDGSAHKGGRGTAGHVPVPVGLQGLERLEVKGPVRPQLGG
jgi:hypothetical protein